MREKLSELWEKIMHPFKTLETDQKEKTFRITLSDGRYIGDIDIPCGVYQIRALSGRGRVTAENDTVNLDFSGKIYPRVYNGFEIRSGFTVKIDLNGIVLFTRTRDVSSMGMLYQETSENIKSANKDYDLMDGWQFEDFCANVLRQSGYKNVKVTQGSGDQGVDVLAERDGIKYAIQCKNYSQPVGNKAVQEVLAGKQFYHCHVGIVMTNNYFTQSAKDLAKENGIILWDRDYLEKFIGTLKEDE